MALAANPVFFAMSAKSGSSWGLSSSPLGSSESYTALLLTSKEDKCLGKVVEEAGEVVMAAKDDDHDHIRYGMGDLLYHLLVVAERYGITLDELAGELNARMK